MKEACGHCVHWHPYQSEEEGIWECVLSDPVYQALTGRKPPFERTGAGLFLTRAHHRCNEFEVGGRDPREADEEGP